MTTITFTTFESLEGGSDQTDLRKASKERGGYMLLLLEKNLAVFLRMLSSG